MQIWRLRAGVAAIVLVVLFANHPRHRWEDIRRFFGEELARGLSEFTKPGAGERELPRRVQAMLALLRGHGVETYRVSPRIAADALISQRIVESAWPIRPYRAANWYLAFSAEALPASCRLLDHREDVVLARCS